MFQRRGSVKQKHGAILDFLPMLQDADNGLGGGKQGYIPEIAIAAVEEVEFPSFKLMMKLRERPQFRKGPAEIRV